jgi:hypothetical protein
VPVATTIGRGSDGAPLRSAAPVWSDSTKTETRTNGRQAAKKARRQRKERAKCLKEGILPASLPKGKFRVLH